MRTGMGLNDAHQLTYHLGSFPRTLNVWLVPLPQHPVPRVPVAFPSDLTAVLRSLISRSDTNSRLQFPIRLLKRSRSAAAASTHPAKTLVLIVHIHIPSLDGVTTQLLA